MTPLCQTSKMASPGAILAQAWPICSRPQQIGWTSLRRWRAGANLALGAAEAPLQAALGCPTSPARGRGGGKAHLRALAPPPRYGVMRRRRAVRCGAGGPPSHCAGGALGAARWRLDAWRLPTSLPLRRGRWRRGPPGSRFSSARDRGVGPLRVHGPSLGCCGAGGPPLALRPSWCSTARSTGSTVRPTSASCRRCTTTQSR